MRMIILIIFIFMNIGQLNSQIPQRFDVIITEIMADPSPPVGLPAAEFIEIKNTSGRVINVGGWKLATSSNLSGSFPDHVLPADSILIISSNSNAALFTQYGRSLGIPSFPALDNDGTELSLISKEGRIIHAVSYFSSWHQNQVKQQGGWSLEMTDPLHPCSGKNNWTSSVDAKGGTPGKTNSTDGKIKDESPPQLVRTYAKDSMTVVAIFNEPLDSMSASLPGNYIFSDNIGIISALPQAPQFDHVILKTSLPLNSSQVYKLIANNVKDCKNNSIGVYNHTKAGRPLEADKNDAVINEILFNPRSDGSDYVEIFNNSNKILDASGMFINNKNSMGQAGIPKKISEKPFYIFPGDYFIITEESSSIEINYLVQHPELIFIISQFPSYPDDKGTVIITNSSGSVIDEVNYSDQWHFALISNADGIALERLDPSAKSQDPHNWHSASSASGYGTPTYKNSQFRQVQDNSFSFQIHPKVFSPDNNGIDDITQLSYAMEEPGYVGNLTIFDARGRLVNRFIKNQLMGNKGTWTWDGLDENKNKLPSGIYVIYAEVFNLQGKKRHFKETVVVM